MSSREATVNEVLKTTLFQTGIQSITMLEGEKGKVLELIAKSGSKIVKKQIKNMKFPKGALICTVVRGIEIIIPDGDIQIQPGDEVIVFTLPEVVSKVEAFFK
jgi:trk system potassium uptake protein TrkA